MTREEALRQAREAEACASRAAEVLGQFIGHLEKEGDLDSDEAARCYVTAAGQLKAALAALDRLGVRRPGRRRGGERH